MAAVFIIFVLFLIREVPTENVLFLPTSVNPQTGNGATLLFWATPLIIGFQGDIRAGAINTHHTC